MSLFIWQTKLNLPFGFHSESVGIRIGNTLGSFMQSDPTNFNGQWNSYIRIKVGIDVRRPI